MVEMRILRVQYRRPTTVSALTAPWDTGHRPPRLSCSRIWSQYQSV